MSTCLCLTVEHAEREAEYRLVKTKFQSFQLVRALANHLMRLQDSEICEMCPKGTYSTIFTDEWPLGCTFCPSTSYQDEVGRKATSHE